MLLGSRRGLLSSAPWGRTQAACLTQPYRAIVGSAQGSSRAPIRLGTTGCGGLQPATTSASGRPHSCRRKPQRPVSGFIRILHGPLVLGRSAVC